MGMGANNLANTFGAAIGSRAVRFGQAATMASVMLVAGSFLLSGDVSDTVRLYLLDLDFFTHHPEQLVIVNWSSLFGSAVVMLPSLYFGIPMSGTHAILGGLVGASLAYRRHSVHWASCMPLKPCHGFTRVLLSWIFAPMFAALFAIVMMYISQLVLLRAPTEAIRRRAPGLIAGVMGLTTFVLFYFVIITQHNRPVLAWNNTAGKLFCALVGVVVAFVAETIFVNKPSLLKISSGEAEEDAQEQGGFARVPDADACAMCIPGSVSHGQQNPHAGGSTGGFSTLAPSWDGTYRDPLMLYGGGYRQERANSSENPLEHNHLSPRAPHQHNVVPIYSVYNIFSRGYYSDPFEGDIDWKMELHNNAERYNPAAENAFKSVQVYASLISAFAEGANNGANLAAPLATIWVTYSYGKIDFKDIIPWWSFFFCGAALIVGLYTVGLRVVRTVSQNLTKITHSRGLCVELGSSMAVLAASSVGLPVSSTHCTVAAVAGVAYIGGVGDNADVFANLNKRKMAEIALAWLLTPLFSGSISACAFLTIDACIGWN
ncbi:hypothetical protein CYMTET_6261 [Cymbomonas tetramitiformis]|uniref:Phosphate transporter n=1 Tax=Cymbomonas tetramitiformis TaxID=36881 RepID=A0AAE0GXT3_9CHLO|nr:hypothetical protein CYMTET_6261 [Cymbomonas tetramitiformis]